MFQYEVTATADGIEIAVDNYVIERDSPLGIQLDNAERAAQDLKIVYSEAATVVVIGTVDPNFRPGVTLTAITVDGTPVTAQQLPQFAEALDLPLTVAVPLLAPPVSAV